MAEMAAGDRQPVTGRSAAWRRAVPMVLLLVCGTQMLAQENRIVVGPKNLPLHEGAEALMAGNADEGVKLTLRGLQLAANASERETAKLNLCAGYALLKQYSTALAYCDEVIQEDDRNWRAFSNRALIYIMLERYAEADQDLIRGESINSDAATLQAVRRMYLNATDPVSPNIIIDDRRGLPEEGDRDDVEQP